MKNRGNIQSLDFLLENQNTSNGVRITNNDIQVQPEEACLWEEDMRVLAEGIAQLNEKRAEDAGITLYGRTENRTGRPGHGCQPAQGIPDPHDGSA